MMSDKVGVILVQNLAGGPAGDTHVACCLRPDDERGGTARNLLVPFLTPLIMTLSIGGTLRIMYHLHSRLM